MHTVPGFWSQLPPTAVRHKQQLLTPQADSPTTTAGLLLLWNRCRTGLWSQFICDNGCNFPEISILICHIICWYNWNIFHQRLVQLLKQKGKKKKPPNNQNWLNFNLTREFLEKPFCSQQLTASREVSDSEHQWPTYLRDRKSKVQN